MRSWLADFLGGFVAYGLSFTSLFVVLSTASAQQTGGERNWDAFLPPPVRVAHVGSLGEPNGPGDPVQPAYETTESTPRRSSRRVASSKESPTLARPIRNSSVAPENRSAQSDGVAQSDETTQSDKTTQSVEMRRGEVERAAYVEMESSVLDQDGQWLAPSEPRWMPASAYPMAAASPPHRVIQAPRSTPAPSAVPRSGGETWMVHPTTSGYNSSGYSSGGPAGSNAMSHVYHAGTSAVAGVHRHLPEMPGVENDPQSVGPGHLGLGTHWLKTRPRPRQTIPGATVEPGWKTPYSYGYFGSEGKRHWTRQHGYRDRYLQWTLR
ncbi:hypothetical protein [Rhodopirellula sallentina]|uniref:Putative secreted protein n=1 Tax=Rhodopirellula sallentina SM41 TaxID=1263870 RepID=M5UAT6_9BACT|nr:hypothetical protein [Rhodopirellula sallentina]EMI53108.1 putative secreted protein [Rhodopirellula sallentina SM41]